MGNHYFSFSKKTSFDFVKNSVLRAKYFRVDAVAATLRPRGLLRVRALGSCDLQVPLLRQSEQCGVYVRSLAPSSGGEVAGLPPERRKRHFCVSTRIRPAARIQAHQLYITIIVRIQSNK